MQRIPSSCMATTLNLNADNSISNNCLTFSWSQISRLTTSYTTYIDSNINQTYYAQIAALTVLGKIDNYSLNYQCPPAEYNGVPSDCKTQPNTELVVLHISALDGKLYAIDVILSGTPFPAPETLNDNQPPFGKARHQFTTGIRIRSTGYFQICKKKNSNQCPNMNLNARKLPNPLPSSYGYGIFGAKSFNLVTDSILIMDDSNKLLILTAGTSYYYFNATGFFIYDSSENTCKWFSSCNYICEAYNYNSRFLDFGGEWIITEKWGVNNMEPLTVETWIGHAIDATGVFPIIMYTDKQSGHYLGLDKLDTVLMENMGTTYWYTIHGNTTPRTTIEAYQPNVVNAGCVKSIDEWMGVRNNAGIGLRFQYIRIILTIIVLNYLSTMDEILF
ncbi:unnamed protein product [Rotaria sordida]|uniref:Uncharacterized protein n=1 Tax=Rotaria sordida TaxID=392033 RepID=A0A813YHP2_9BILA|nr:unnamed protein product [Rotaria sordida]